MHHHTADDIIDEEKQQGRRKEGLVELWAVGYYAINMLVYYGVRKTKKIEGCCLPNNNQFD